MKKILIIATLLTLVACDSNSSKMETKIVLINGEKWEVNAEMQPFILKGNEILSDYITSNKTDYRALAKELKAQNSKLIDSCTMKGKAHDELHKWLHPHMNLIEELEDADNPTQANEIIELLKTSFNNYHEHFK